MTQLLHTLPISSYWLFRIIAIIFALVLAIIKRKSFGLTLPDTLKLGAFSAFGAIVGAKALYFIGQVIMHGSEPAFCTWDNWSLMAEAGGVLYGSLLGVIGMIALFAKIFKHKVIDILGIASIALFGANFFPVSVVFFSGCCYGIQFSNGHQFPYQWTEGILCALICFYLVLWTPEKNHKDKIFPFSVVLYSVIRFVLEFFRGDEGRGAWFSLSSSQWIAIVLILIGVAWFVKSVKKKRDNNLLDATQMGRKKVIANAPCSQYSVLFSHTARACSNLYSNSAQADFICVRLCH